MTPIKVWFNVALNRLPTQRKQTMMTPSTTLDRIHEEAFGVEQVHFKKTKKRTNPKKSDPFMVMEGPLPVVVCAPHSVRTIRGGKIKRSDIFTGAYGFLLSRHTGCNAIAVKKLYGGDPEHDSKCIYKQRLGELVRKCGAKLILDLQGAPNEAGFDIEILSRAPKGLVVSLQKCLQNEEITGVSLCEEEPGEFSVVNYCKETIGVPAIRLTLHRRFRAPDRNGADFVRMFKALSRFIELEKNRNGVK